MHMENIKIKNKHEKQNVNIFSGEEVITVWPKNKTILKAKSKNHKRKIDKCTILKLDKRI